MLPDATNVYALLTAPEGLQAVLQALANVFPPGEGSLSRSQFDDAVTLRFRSESAEFDSEPLEDGIEHILKGAVGGPLEAVVNLVRALSEALEESGIDHRFEIYDDDENLLESIPPLPDEPDRFEPTDWDGS